MKTEPRSARTVLSGSARRFSLAAACRLCLTLCAVLLAPALAAAQAATTTISGTVYDPRTTNAFPLPHILVYVTTSTPDPLPTGVQCLTTASIPSGAIAYATSAVDGTFTITGVPVSTAYTLVIQAGKWRRQFPLQVDTAPVTGLQLHMPADHTQGDIPLIAIATGSVDGFECVFRDMGIADSEFSDDNLDPTFIKRVHLYKGLTSSGAAMNTSTPSEATLINNAATLSNYDVVMFPCQGGPAAKTAAQMSNVVNYANIGGRVFATHYSYDWLNSASPYYSTFTSTTGGVTTGVANWQSGANPTPDPGIATVSTGFTDGSDLAQWLYNVGATYNSTRNQIQVSTLRHDFTTVIAPTQSWLSLSNSTNANGAIMQFTFNAPVGGAAANQCGRVLFNEYHVMAAGNNTGKIYPAECTTSSSMSAQEAMLEYALFDLSAFVQPVVVPTLTLSFAPSPVIVNQGDTADQLTITATNTSSTIAIDPSAVLTLTLPAGITATALSDSTGGWSCTLSTLTCARTASIPSSSADAVVLTVSVPSYSVSGITSFAGQITATVSSPTFSSNVVATDPVIFQQTPAINWPTPAPIVYGTALGSAQLNASASIGATNIPGTFVYNPASGAVLSVGTHILNTTFTPTDAVHYTTATGATSITVLTATPTVTVSSNTNPIFLSNPVTFTATVSSLGTIPTGTVTFYDGSTQIGSGAVASSGTATFTTTSLSAGVHTISAAYSGDTTYNPASSSTISQLIEDFTLTIGGSGTANLGLGQNATFPITVSPVVSTSFPAAISFTVSGMAPETSASFSPASIASGTGSIVDYMTISMASSFAAAPNTPFSPRRTLPLMLGLLVLPFAFRLRRAARRWQRLLPITLAALALATGIAACGFDYNPKTATVTVTATSGALSHTATVKVTVQ